MNSFKCSKCSYNTIRNYDLTRRLKSVHGIYANTSVKLYNQPQAELPTRMSEERRYREVSYRPQDRMEEQDTSEEEEEEEETRTHSVEGLHLRTNRWHEKKKVSHIRLRVGYISWTSENESQEYVRHLKVQRSFVHSPEPRNCNWRRDWPRKQHTRLAHGFIDRTTETRNNQIHDAQKGE